MENDEDEILETLDDEMENEEKKENGPIMISPLQPVKINESIETISAALERLKRHPEEIETKETMINKELDFLYEELHRQQDNAMLKDEDIDIIKRIIQKLSELQDKYPGQFIEKIVENLYMISTMEQLLEDLENSFLSDLSTVFNTTLEDHEYTFEKNHFGFDYPHLIKILLKIGYKYTQGHIRDAINRNNTILFEALVSDNIFIKDNKKHVREELMKRVEELEAKIETDRTKKLKGIYGKYIESLR